MMIVKFRSKEEHSDLLKKVKKMKKFAEEIEECFEDVIEDEDVDFRGGRYKDDYDEDMEHGSRYGSYRRYGGRR